MPSRADVAAADAATAAWVRTTPRRLAGRPARRHDEGVAVVDSDAAGEPGDHPVGADDPGRPQGRDEGGRGRPRQARIERGGGVAGIPDRSEGVDEARSAGEVEGDELGHPPVA